MMPSTRRLIKARIFSGSLVVHGMMRKPAFWSSATLTAGLGPRTVASLGERVGVGALWALAWVLAAMRSARQGSWFCIGFCIGGMVVRRAVRAAARMETSMSALGVEEGGEVAFVVG